MDDLIERLLHLAASCDSRAAVDEPNDPAGMAELLREAANLIAVAMARTFELENAIEKGVLLGEIPSKYLDL